ncbi:MULTISPECIES: DUF6161 domain-containing protein [Pseudomonadaceae]|uniref:DUF6161 domain-containing protein n=4 Tax=Gammaproteobacteria TaxID=1236 RepID=A0ABU7HJE6_9PSED|nr:MULTISPECIES: DUF6161 domain-containing protein [Pseudomonas]AZN03116.1 hypothetical protein EJA96_28735 [Pseudomonas aeruginosa]AZN55233.1 hypothetical protein EJP70_30035 [Pseudomonas aeruginosa]AZP57600.1 Uncharacterized protein PA1840_0405 [Pseudomonas aeruginosa]EIU4874787.1 hypothetical protein [Pseudomonas aeruginosa]EKU5566184.1 hypothetical protein [Pseudomonas aeruginosa]
MKDRTINFRLTDCAGHVTNFLSLRSFLTFCEAEASFWKERKQIVQTDRNSANHTHLNAGDVFTRAADTIQGWKDNIEVWSDDDLSRQLQQLQQSYFQRLQRDWLWRGHPFVEPFVQCLKEHGDNTANAFLDFSIRKSVQNISNIEHFKGYMYAYEFANQDSQIVKRRHGEKLSLGHLRTQFADAQDKLFTEFGELKSEITDWDTQNRASSSRLAKVQKALGRRKIKSQSNAFERQLAEWTEKVTTLESTYEEKLKLKKPAEYWAKSARKYGIQGGLWTLAIVALVIVAAINFQEIFVTWLQGRETPVQLNTIQGVILFGSLAGVYAFLLRVLSRLAFSSFHLMRDAEEREQLTYLYLSLTNEAEIDKESRDIVLQALFSRSETGLLAQEHGPTMPGASEMLRSTLRGRGQ